MRDDTRVRTAVREHYARAARQVSSSEAAGCCGPAGCGSTAEPDANVISRGLYDNAELEGVPQAAALASLGCGNPTAVAELRPGETVLDLGSGGGIDVLLSARRVGPTGKAYGIDMTDEMLELARRNQREAGVENAEFLKGEMEDLPLPPASVDVIISNCVINLSADKDRVLREAFRVLKPGGRFAVADIVALRRLPAAVRSSLEAWSGCIAGALFEGEYRAKLAAAGFEDIEIEVLRTFGLDEVVGGEAPSAERRAGAWVEEGSLSSALVRARKPA